MGSTLSVGIDCPTSSGAVDGIAVTVALQKLTKIEDLAHFTVNSARTGHSAIASHALGIYGNAGEAALRLKLRVDSERDMSSLSFNTPEDYFPYVCALAHEVKMSLEELTEGQGQVDEKLSQCQDDIAEKLSVIRSAMSQVKDWCNEHRTVTSTSETRTSGDSNDYTGPTRIFIKHFVDQGQGVKSISETFVHIPDFNEVHDLGARLLQENGLAVYDFILDLDGTVLQNSNTLPLLKALVQEMHHISAQQPSATLFLKLRGDNPYSAPITAVKSVPNALQCEFSSPRAADFLDSGQEKFLICIEGNIGSRKSDLIMKLLEINGLGTPCEVCGTATSLSKGQESVLVIREPLSTLGDEMQAFYDALKAAEGLTDQQRNRSSRFEEGMFDHHFWVATESRIRKRHVISERSMDAKIYVFNELNYEQNRLLKEARDKMKKTFEEDVRGKKGLEPHAIIFFDIEVGHAMERIRERGRKSEKDITPNYLQAIEDKYAKLYPKGPEAKPHVIRLESNQPMEDTLVAIQNKLPPVLKASRTSASNEEIANFMRFFQDLRSEPPAAAASSS